MARVVRDSWTEAGAANVTLLDHTADLGGPWLPRADYPGEFRVLPASVHQVISSPLLGPGLNFFTAAPVSADINARMGFGVTAACVDGVASAGNVTLTGGAAGSINTVTVNGVNIIPSGAVAFNTSLNQTANDLTVKINADTTAGLYAGIRYLASVVGAVVTITADKRTGTFANGFVVATTTTTITTTTANLAAGTQGTLPDSMVGFCYRIRTANTFYRVRPHPTTALWVLEKVVSGIITVLATAIGRPTAVGGVSQGGIISVSAVGNSHRVHITDTYLGGFFGPYVLTATDSAIPGIGGFGIWGSGGGTSSGSAPTENVTKAVYFDASAANTDLEAGTAEIAATIPAMSLTAIGTVGTLVIAAQETPVGGVILGGAAAVVDVFNVPTLG